MPLVNWFRKRREAPRDRLQRPSGYELASSIASTLDGFIEVDGLQNFQSGDDLALIVAEDYEVLITRMPSPSMRGRAILFAIPLSEIEISPIHVQLGGAARHEAVDAAAIRVMQRFNEQFGKTRRSSA
ncbi:MAG TPA: hypothetical protein VJN94_02850 [Candidatus Binataceae bacterium]|nr:hypothetical protein [Candidatus Binataceae bacterium]